MAKPDTCGEPDAATVQVTGRYGTACVMVRDRIHPRLTTRAAWIDHTGELFVIETTLMRLEVDRLPGGHDPHAVWLWTSVTGLTGEDIESVLAGVPTQIRPGTRLPDDQTDPRLDPPENPHAPGG